ncbi:hypothetical protein ACFXPQ_04915 [Streptomyces lydicus]|uniref:hypothetical protein n=1 Tax=Streptomyces lydicus TaxID=47763 RepID=UPI00368AD09E
MPCGLIAHRGVRVGMAYLSWADTAMIRAADRYAIFQELRARMLWPASKIYPAQLAVVVEVDNGKTDECTLRTRDGREISPQMTDGCDPESVERGDRLRVLYDPEGAAGPLEDEDTEVDLDPGAYGGTIGGLAALTVVAGTWRCGRLNRRGEE